MRSRLAVALITVVAVGGLGAAPSPSAAEPSQPAAETAAGCVEVEVNGVRAPSFPCLTQKLRPRAQPAEGPSAQQLASEKIAQRPGNQLGLFNYSATSQRMGNTFGTSVLPQRPSVPTAGPAVIPRSQP